MTELAAAFARIPLLAGFDPTGQPVGSRGLTNVNYLVDTGTERLVLRIPGAGTSEYIDRTRRGGGGTFGGAAGVNAEVVFFDATDG
jgi:hypothetical protein